MPRWISGFIRPFAIGFGVAVVGAIYSLSLPDYYRSEAHILPVDVKGATGNLGGLAVAAAAFGVGLPGSEGIEGNFVDILASRWLREELLNTEFQYHYRTWRFGNDVAVRETLLQHLKAKNIDRGVSMLGTLLFFSRDPKSKILTIWAETNSPDLSQQVVHRATSLLESFVMRKGMSRGGNKAAFASQRLKEVEADYARAEDEFRRFSEGNRNFRGSSDPNVYLKGLRLESELKLRQQLYSTLALNREQALLEEKNDMPILNVLDAGALPLEKSRPARAKLVLGIFSLSFAAAWAWLNRQWLREKLAEN